MKLPSAEEKASGPIPVLKAKLVSQGLPFFLGVKGCSRSQKIRIPAAVDEFEVRVTVSR